MKRILTIILALPLLTACGQSSSSPESVMPTEEAAYTEQTAEQFGIQPEKGYVPLNYSYVKGEWLPYMRYEEMMSGRSADDFRSAFREYLTDAAGEGINTVYLHVHPCGDAYYRSEIFPAGAYLKGDYDPLEIMLGEAHALGISAHAWINPLRCQTVEQMQELPGDFIVKEWSDAPDCRIAKTVNGRWYLDPAYEETDRLLCRCIAEIIGNYDVDGIHIDDYFYPESDPSFDAEEFSVSGADDLSQWRLSNCTRMVRSMYDAVKAADSRVQFGISPQGSISGNYNSQFADVKLWCGSEGYCDYIAPQLYFGFRNESCPFAETLAMWEDMTSDKVELVIGLGAYKLGKPDKWAGAAGESEWADEPDIIERQIALVGASSADGYALYK